MKEQLRLGFEIGPAVQVPVVAKPVPKPNRSKRLRRYSVANAKGHGLGIFVIADDGYFSAVSCFGGYAHYWDEGCFSGDFREFLAQIDGEYLLEKVSRRSEYDGKATTALVKKHILEHRRGDLYGKEDARLEWNILVEAETGGEHGLASHRAFVEWLNGTELADAAEFAVYDYPCDARNFASVVWPLFVDVLKAELKSDRRGK